MWADGHSRAVPPEPASIRPTHDERRDRSRVVGHERVADVDTCTVLVVGTDDWAIEQAVHTLEEAGHRTVRCHDPSGPPFPCNALIEGRRCSLDVGFDVAVTIRTRPGAAPTVSEFGAICALRTGHPLVIAGMSQPNPFQPWAAQIVGRNDDIPGACEDVEQARRAAEPEIDLRDPK